MAEVAAEGVKFPGWKRTTTKRSAHERFWEKVDIRGRTECWPWTGFVMDTGYGQFWDGRRLVKAHNFIAPSGEGKVTDHTCHNDSGCQGGATCVHRSCVNPLHLEVVPFRENVRRGMAGKTARAWKTQCVHGHAYTEANTYIDPKGHQRCRECAATRYANRKAVA